MSSVSEPAADPTSSGSGASASKSKAPSKTKAPKARPGPARQKRPSRDETRQRLLTAAAEVFVVRGLGNTSIEEICDAAGFSRGAFYSNFATKDDLVLQLLENHLEETVANVEAQYERAASPLEFLAGIGAEPVAKDGPLRAERRGVLRMELMLHAARNPECRPRLVSHQRRLHAMYASVLDRIATEIDRELPAPTDDMAALLIGFDEGLSLMQLLDPGFYRDSQYADMLVTLHRMWMHQPT